MRYYIYVLHDPRDSHVHYVGCTSDPSYRILCHFYKRTDDGKGRWIEDLLEHKLFPQMRVVVIVGTKEEGRRIERIYEQILRRRGEPLKNYVQKERNQKIKKALQGHVIPLDVRRKISASVLQTYYKKKGWI